MDFENDPVYQELTTQHPYTIMTLPAVAEDLGIPYVFLLHEVYDALRFARQAEAGAGE